MNTTNLKTTTKKVPELLKSCRGVLLSIISSVLVITMAICLLVNYGIAQKIAEHSEGVYIVTAIWFAIVAFCSCKYLRGDSGNVKLVSTTGKRVVKKGD